MTRLEIILSAVLLFSVLLNIGLIYYARGTIVRLLTISEELGDLQQMINSFAIHAKTNCIRHSHRCCGDGFYGM